MFLLATDEEHEFEENVGVVDKKNEVESDHDDSWHSEELRSPISSDDEDGSGKHAFHQFNEAAEFDHNSLEMNINTTVHNRDD
ncbi:hypothetical protein A2U01_0036023 [Trifolium medium]|uniref:Uncharacterized protein n=1 Tax=Trifolium medium TaxID=97028 RepID=A0A392PTQ9_9FABA|nr:hypothetical protein [Trifolium medium]